LAERIASLRPDTRILFMSGYTDDMLLKYRVRNQAAAFLQKPFTSEALMQRVRDVLDSG
jgi:DNA-binding NarL/FixJ family response regulator